MSPEQPPESARVNGTVSRRLRLVRRLPSAALSVAVALPSLVRSQVALARHRDIRVLLEHLDRPLKTPSRPLDRRAERTFEGVRWGLWLIGKRKDACLPRSLALFTALRAQGHPVRFVSGVRRDGPKIVGHAWIELNGKPIPGWGDEDAPQLFAVNLAYPPLEPGVQELQGQLARTEDEG